jgi:hypothetical protein
MVLIKDNQPLSEAVRQAYAAGQEDEMLEAIVRAAEVVTVMGRYWPLARENTPDRVEKACRVLVHGRE